MKTIFIRRALVAALTFLSLAAFAQTPPANGPRTIPTRTLKLPPGAKSPTFEGFDLVIEDNVIRWQLGTATNLEANVKNIVDVLRVRYPQANIVISPRLQSVAVGDLKLHSNHLPEDLEAVRIASGEKFEIISPTARAFTSPGGVDPATGLPMAPQPNDENSGLWVLREHPGPPKDPRTVDVFNIGNYLEAAVLQAKEPESARSKVIQNAIDSLIRMVKLTIDQLDRGGDADIGSVDFQFHEGASLLVVIGSNTAVSVARKVINALPSVRPSGAAAAASQTEFTERLTQILKNAGATPPPTVGAPTTPPIPARPAHVPK